MGSRGCNGRVVRASTVQATVVLLCSAWRGSLPTLVASSHSFTLLGSLQARVDRIPHEETLGLSRDLLGSHHYKGAKLPVHRAPTCTVSSDICLLLTHSVRARPKIGGGSMGEARGESPLAVKNQSMEQKMGPLKLDFTQKSVSYQQLGPGMASMATGKHGDFEDMEGGGGESCRELQSPPLWWSGQGSRWP